MPAKPFKKQQKNKGKRGDIIFEKFELNIENEYKYLNEKPIKSSISKLLKGNYSRTQSHWISTEEYKKEILLNCEERIKFYQISYSEIFALGIEMNWNFEKIDQILKKTIRNTDQIYETKTILFENNEKCDICEEMKLEFSTLECNHKFCTDCYKIFIINLLNNEGPIAVTKTCPIEGCKAIISSNFIKQIFGENSLEYNKYQKLLTIYLFMSRDPIYKKCPSNDCDYLFKIKKSKLVKSIQCPSNHSFCSKCFREAHPSVISCRHFEIYQNHENKQNASMSWIMINAKKCPECKSPIVKNDGCDHMTCKMCKHEFCWLCFSVWKTHNKINCDTLKNIIEKNKVALIIKEKKKLFLFENFACFYPSSMSQMKIIELKYKELFSKVESYINTNNFIHIEDINIVKNIMDFLFETEKNLVFGKEFLNLKKEDEYLKLILGKIEEMLKYFIKPMNYLETGQDFFNFFLKIDQNTIAYDKCIHINEQIKSFKYYFGFVK